MFMLFHRRIKLTRGGCLWPLTKGRSCWRISGWFAMIPLRKCASSSASLTPSRQSTTDGPHAAGWPRKPSASRYQPGSHITLFTFSKYNSVYYSLWLGYKYTHLLTNTLGCKCDLSPPLTFFFNYLSQVFKEVQKQKAEQRLKMKQRLTSTNTDKVKTEAASSWAGPGFGYVALSIVFVIDCHRH